VWVVTRTITQRELRNGSAAVMDAVESGETVVVTRNGNPVAELRPIRRSRLTATAELMRAFHGLPRVNYGAMRAEADGLLDEDRVGD
jgi:prevent-host-death family protein